MRGCRFRPGRVAPAGLGLDGAMVLDAQSCDARRVLALHRMQTRGGFCLWGAPWGRTGGTAASTGREARRAEARAQQMALGGPGCVAFACRAGGTAASTQASL